MRVSMLAMGERKYGDATLCQIDGRNILIDGGHINDDALTGDTPAFADQVQALIGTPPPFQIDLLIVTHCHADHIGCLPELVRDSRIKVAWALVADPRMGFGVPLDRAFPVETRSSTERVSAALREEPLTGTATDAEVQELIDAAATLQQRYAEMLERLSASGTEVIRYGRNPHGGLEREFASVDLRVLGPTVDQLLICAHRIERERESRQPAAGSAEQTDGADEIALYRSWVSRALSDAPELEDGGVGAAVNNQSIVVRVGRAPRAILLTGDMQFASPDVGGLRTRMTELRRTVENAGPYRFVHLSHHGAGNGTDAGFLEQLAETRLFGISTGAADPLHPAPDVLSLLATREPAAEWARTDRNGRVTLLLEGSERDWSIGQGAISDATPNEHRAGGPAVRKALRRSRRRSSTASDADGSLLPPASEIGRLTFVTNLKLLKERIGEAADEALELVRRGSHGFLDVRDAGSPAIDIALAARGSAGLVLLGGHGVMPSLLVDALPPALRTNLRRGSPDADDFTVWSDDPYGDPDGLGLATVPVSRVPDLSDGSFLLKALKPFRRPSPGRFGLRNRNRPFADEIYALLPGDAAMLLSDPLRRGGVDPEALNVDNVYLQLHGTAYDASTFWGEEAGPEADDVTLVGAFATSDLPASVGGVVFAGCCYGAQLLRGFGPADIEEIAAGESLALAFLKAGARAFVGCNGTHYSPGSAPYRAAAGPLHQAFWQSIAAGRSPARALLEAKSEYAFGMPYDGAREIEYKTWRQFTCLGLGW